MKYCRCDERVLTVGIHGQTQGEAEDLVPAERPQVFNPSEWDDDEIWETSTAIDERDVLVPGTTRHKQAEQQFLEANKVVPQRPAFISVSMMVDARTHQTIDHVDGPSARLSRGRSDSIDTQNSQNTQSSTSLRTISATTANTPQAAIRRAAWNDVIRKVDYRLYELQVPVPIYVDVVVPVNSWEVY